MCEPFGIEPPIHRRRVDFFTKSRAFTIRKAREMLGYHPEVDLRQGIEATLAAYLTSGQIAGLRLSSAALDGTLPTLFF